VVPIDPTEYQKMLDAGDVDRIVVVNEQQVRVYIKKDRLAQPPHKDKIKDSFSGPNTVGPHYVFNIGTADLLKDRLVEGAPGGGLTVAQLDRQRVHELYMFRASIEGAAAEMAALQATELDIADLSDALEQMRAVAEDARRAALLNRRFHEGIYRAARNSFLGHAIATMSDFMTLLPGTTYDLPGRAAEVMLEHERVLEAIVARDSGRAARAMRDHIQMASQFRLRMTAT
jgi:DNA-binding GntR family transcriptional regulator